VTAWAGASTRGGQAEGCVVAGAGLLLAVWVLARSLSAGGPDFPRPPAAYAGDPRGRIVPIAADAGPPSGLVGTGAERSEADRSVDLNRADRQTLATLPGIGPSLADRIVTDRERRGPFGSPEALLRVPGIGSKRMAQVRPHLTVTEAP
jgi:competence ComEA-like helix-hairpin-helix protein